MTDHDRLAEQFGDHILDSSLAQPGLGAEIAIPTSVQWNAVFKRGPAVHRAVNIELAAS